MKLIICMITAFYISCNNAAARKNSNFYWKTPKYVMPWLKGPNVCAVEEVTESRKRYYSECMTYMPRRICQKPTFIRYHCCSGFEKASDDSKGCQAVAPVHNLSDTLQHLYLKEFRNHAKVLGLNDILRTNNTYTVFAPENRAFLNLSERIKSSFSSKFPETNLVTYHITKERHYLRDLINKIHLPSLHQNNAPIRVNRYANGIVTVNCARLIVPNQIASNGIVHVIEKVIEPISQQQNLMDLLLNDDRFGELVTALIVTQLGNLLRDNTRFHTIFAPTDAAFRKAPADVVERILQDKEILEKLLKYHIIEHNVCSAAILGRARLRTLEGQKVNLTCGVDDKLYINNKVVSQSDILGANGIVHVLDEILIPDSAKSLHEVLMEQEHYEFLEYAQQAGVSDILKGERPDNFTIFVPCVETFQKMTRAEKRSFQSSQKRVRNTIRYHLTPGKITTRTIRGKQTVDTYMEQGIKLRLDVVNGGFTVNGAKILSSNHQAGNGVIHIIDKLLYPPIENARMRMREESALGTFRALMDTAHMDSLLTDETANFTIFAPNNRAFDNVDSTTIESLVLDQKDLRQFLDYHIIRHPVYTSVLDARLEYRFQTRIDGEWIHLKQVEPGIPFVINKSAKILSSPIEATNAIIYIIDDLLYCPCLWGDNRNEV